MPPAPTAPPAPATPPDGPAAEPAGAAGLWTSGTDGGAHAPAAVASGDPLAPSATAAPAHPGTTIEPMTGTLPAVPDGGATGTGLEPAPGHTAVQPAVTPVPPGAAVGPAAAAEPAPARPGVVQRSRLRRRMRELRQLRELAFRDLGGLVFDLRRFGADRPDLVAAKLGALGEVDRELRTIETVLRQRREVVELREVGLAGCPRCGTVHGSDANFCPHCGLPQHGGPQPVAEPAATPVAAAPEAAGAGPAAAAPALPPAPDPLGAAAGEPAPTTTAAR